MSLATDLEACVRCPLYAKQDTDRYGKTAVVVPPEVGHAYRPGGLLILGDSPGFYETLGKQRGRPLVGNAGDLFEQMAQVAGLSRGDFVLDYLVRHRVPNNRLRDYPEAILGCSHWTSLVMQQYDPRVVVVMGSEVIKSVYGAEASVGNTRGTLTSLPAKHPWGRRLVMATYSPSAAVYQGGIGSDVARMIIHDLAAARHAAYVTAGVALGVPTTATAVPREAIEAGHDADPAQGG